MAQSHFPNSITRYRLKFYPRPLTQDELAQLIGVHRNRVSLYEIGAVFPSGQMLFRIAAALNVLPEVLFKAYFDDVRNQILEQKKQIGVIKTKNQWRK